MLKILQARLQQYMNHEFSDFQTGFRKDRGTRDQIANICGIIIKAREFQKNIYFCFIDYARAFDSVDHNKLWKMFQEMGIADHLTFLLRNLYAGQEDSDLLQKAPCIHMLSAPNLAAGHRQPMPLNYTSPFAMTRL